MRKPEEMPAVVIISESRTAYNNNLFDYSFRQVRLESANQQAADGILIK